MTKEYQLSNKLAFDVLFGIQHKVHTVSPCYIAGYIPPSQMRDIVQLGGKAMLR
jgi:hypothetical protein